MYRLLKVMHGLIASGNIVKNYNLLIRYYFGKLSLDDIKLSLLYQSLL